MYKKWTYKKSNYKKQTYKEWTYKKITDPLVAVFLWFTLCTVWAGSNYNLSFGVLERKWENKGHESKPSNEKRS